MQEAGIADILTRPEIVGLWLQALLTFAILSFLVADNPVYKLAEHIFVGISAGYGVVIVWHQAVLPVMVFKMFPHLAPGEPGEPNYWVVIPVLLGLMMLSRFIPKVDWLSRWPMALVVGLSAGLSIPLVVQMNLLEQMRATVEPLLGPEVMWYDTVNRLLLIVGVICTLSYFYFSLEHRGALGVSSKVGIWFLMVAFGAGFGNTVMGRVSLLIGRVQFLVYEWWPVAKEGIGAFWSNS